MNNTRQVISSNEISENSTETSFKTSTLEEHIRNVKSQLAEASRVIVVTLAD